MQLFFGYYILKRILLRIQNNYQIINTNAIKHQHRCLVLVELYIEIYLAFNIKTDNKIFKKILNVLTLNFYTYNMLKQMKFLLK